MGFDHNKLDVYRPSIQFVVLADAITGELPRGRAYLVDQLNRASASIPLNVAEGAGEFASAEKLRFYRMARRSATECAAILDVCNELRLVDAARFEAGHEMLRRIVSMLVAMSRRS